MMLVLLCTIPAFYAELLQSRPSRIADAVYLGAALMVGTAVLPDESDGTDGADGEGNGGGRAKPTVIESEVQGCGCASAPAQRSGGLLVGALGLLAIVWRRRR